MKDWEAVAHAAKLQRQLINAVEDALELTPLALTTFSKIWRALSLAYTKLNGYGDCAALLVRLIERHSQSGTAGAPSMVTLTELLTTAARAQDLTKLQEAMVWWPTVYAEYVTQLNDCKNYMWIPITAQR